MVSCEPASQQRLSAASIKRYSADEAWKYATTPSAAGGRLEMPAAVGPRRRSNRSRYPEDSVCVILIARFLGGVGMMSIL